MGGQVRARLVGEQLRARDCHVRLAEGGGGVVQLEVLGQSTVWWGQDASGTLVGGQASVWDKTSSGVTAIWADPTDGDIFAVKAADGSFVVWGSPTWQVTDVSAVASSLASGTITSTLILVVFILIATLVGLQVTHRWRKGARIPGRLEVIRIV